MTRKNTRLIILITILALSLSLHLLRIGQEGLGNRYYTAAVKSMLESPSNFFFGSFDGNGFVTVDKPPAGLWIQSLFVLIFGLNSIGLLLPSALAGTASVYLLYLIVRKPFGEIAGLSAAFVLAIIPVSVAVARNNTMDALLTAVLLLSVWLLQNGLQSGRLRNILLSAVVLGIGFNIKMVQAFVILPACLIIFFLYHNPGWRRKILHTVLVAAVLSAVSLSWALAVEWTPDDRRPAIGGTETNSALELMIGYNGLERARGVDNSGGIPIPRNYYFETGYPGFFRLFNPGIGGQIGWFIPFAVFGSLLYLLYSLRTNSLRRSAQQGLIFWGTWFVSLFLYYSFNTGMFHTHYIAMLGPAAAALCGIAVVGCLKVLQKPTAVHWIVFPVLVVSVAGQWLLARAYRDWDKPLVIVLLILAAFSLTVLLLAYLKKRKGRIRTIALISGLLSLAVLPFAWALTPILYGGDSVIPYARPDLKDFTVGERHFYVNQRDFSEYDKLLEFLEKNRRGEEYLLGVESALADGSSLVLITDGDIMALGGFGGSDPLLSRDEIASMVEEGRIRYFLLTMNAAYLNESAAWVMSHGEIVLNKEWKNEGDLVGSFLYDCRPDAAE